VPRRRPDATPPPGYDINRFPPFAVTVDVVVLTVVRRDLHVVLIERHGEPYAGSWALPGGFKTPDETLDDAAARELHEEAGIEAPGRLLQFGTYGDPGRDPRGNIVSVAYLAVGPDVPDLVAGSDAPTPASGPSPTSSTKPSRSPSTTTGSSSTPSPPPRPASKTATSPPPSSAPSSPSASCATSTKPAGENRSTPPTSDAADPPSAARVARVRAHLAPRSADLPAGAAMAFDVLQPIAPTPLGRGSVHWYDRLA
jgi:ADP-ribose pyrophosphatase YjhB (NUDIX family)